MNIAIDLGTSFTYVGTFIDGHFVPLICGKNTNKDAERFGYPTTFQTVPIEGSVTDYQCDVTSNGKVVRIECFSGKGITSIKKEIIKELKDDPNFSFTRPFDPINTGFFWTQNANGVKGTPAIVFSAFFEVLLKLTNNAVQCLEVTDKKLDNIILSFPVVERGTDYKTCLTNSLLKACAKVTWAKNIKEDNIIIEAENRCVPSIFAEELIEKKILFIDIGGATSDYCIKSKGNISGDNPNVAESGIDGTTDIDEDLLISYVKKDKFRGYADSLMLTILKDRLESFAMADLEIMDSEGQSFKTTISRTQYDSLGVWETTFKVFFERLLSLANNAPHVDLIVLSGGASKISNIKKQAEAVFSNITVKTVEEIASEKRLEGVTANNGVCYGAAKVVDLEVRAAGSGDDAKKAQEILGTLQRDSGVATGNYDIRYCYMRNNKSGYHLFMRPGKSIIKPIYSELERLIYVGSVDEVWRIRINKLKEAKMDSNKEFLYENEDATDSDFMNLPLREHTSGVKIECNTEEDVGVIACQGISSTYFLVVTYAGQQINSNGKTYNIGEKINEAYFAENALPQKLIHAPSTKAAYNYAKENGIHPDLADSAYAKAFVGTQKKPDTATSTQPIPASLITYQDKDKARRELAENYDNYYNKLGKWHPIRRSRLKKMYYSYRDKIGTCTDRSKLDSILDKADAEFRRI